MILTNENFEILPWISPSLDMTLWYLENLIFGDENFVGHMVWVFRNVIVICFLSIKMVMYQDLYKNLCTHQLRFRS